MSDFNKYLGRPYIEGLQDCYQICRDYYSEEWGIELPNLARPSRFWEDPNLDLYGMYQKFGFKPVFDKPFEIGDAMLMPILTPVNSHAAIYVADNRILHHMVGQLSSLESLRPKWINRVTIHLRHPEVKQPKPEVINLHEVLDADILRNPRVQEEIERQMGSRN
jgi:cell wall-associated NlpC family hydrolase